MTAAIMAVRVVPLKNVPLVLFCTGTAEEEEEAEEETAEEAEETARVLDGVEVVEGATEDEVEETIFERTPMAPDCMGETLLMAFW